MKSLVILLLITVSISKLTTQLRGTPQAADLSDHFGTETTVGIYGPKPNPGGISLMRRGVVGGGAIVPIKNFAAQIISPQVASGNLSNTSYDASKIIDPEIASKFIFNFRTKSRNQD